MLFRNKNQNELEGIKQKDIQMNTPLDPNPTLLRRIKNYIEELKKGFTLVELAVSIAILFVLVAIASPQLMNLFDKVSSLKHISNKSNIEKAMSEWGQTNKYYAIKAQPTGTTAGTGGTYTDTSVFTIGSADVNHPILTDEANYKFITDSGETAEASLLRIITNNHPIVKGNLLKGGAPDNPWQLRPEYKDYVYTVDFVVKKTVGKNPNGTSYQESEVLPEVRLMKKTAADQLVRNDYIIVVNEKTPVRTGVPSDKSLITDDTVYTREKIYGYDFFTKKSGADTVADPDAVATMVAP